MAPQPNDLFMNVWVMHLNQEDASLPGYPEWDPKIQHRFWAKVWADCVALASHLAQAEALSDQMKNVLKDAPESPELPQPEPTES